MTTARVVQGPTTPEDEYPLKLVDLGYGELGITQSGDIVLRLYPLHDEEYSERVAILGGFHELGDSYTGSAVHNLLCRRLRSNEHIVLRG